MDKDSFISNSATVFLPKAFSTPTCYSERFCSETEVPLGSEHSRVAEEGNKSEVYMDDQRHEK